MTIDMQVVATATRRGDDRLMRFSRGGGDSQVAARPLSRIAALEDWEDAAWSRFLDPGAAAAPQPDPNVWERAHLLYALDRAGKLRRSSRLLIAATLPDELIARLSELVGRVEVFDLSGKRTPRNANAARLFWSNGADYARDRLLIRDDVAGDTAAFDAVVLPHGALLRYGVLGIARMLAEARRLAASDGVVAFKADILVGCEPSQTQLDTGLLGADGLAQRLESDLGLAVEGGFDPRLPLDAMSAGGNAEALKNGSGLLTMREGRVSIPSWWVMRKLTDHPGDGWRRVEGWLSERVLGEQLPYLSLGPAGGRAGQGNIAIRGAGKGRIFYGPYITLPEGRYEVSIAVAAAATASKLTFDLVADGSRLDYRHLRLSGGQAATVRFVFTAPGPLPLERVEVRGSSGGGAAIITACCLRAI